MKCGYKCINLIKRAHPTNLENDLEEFLNANQGKRWLDERTQATQQCLHTDVELNEFNIKED
jgi:hypothetical protein